MLAHGSPVRPKTSPSTINSLFHTGSANHRGKFSATAVQSDINKIFFCFYNIFIRKCDLELCVKSSPGLHSNDLQKTPGVSALQDNVDLGAGTIAHMGYFI